MKVEMHIEADPQETPRQPEAVAQDGPLQPGELFQHAPAQRGAVYQPQQALLQEGADTQQAALEEGADTQQAALEEGAVPQQAPLQQGAVPQRDPMQAYVRDQVALELERLALLVRNDMKPEMAHSVDNEILGLLKGESKSVCCLSLQTAFVQCLAGFLIGIYAWLGLVKREEKANRIFGYVAVLFAIGFSVLPFVMSCVQRRIAYLISLVLTFSAVGVSLIVLIYTTCGGGVGFHNPLDIRNYRQDTDEFVGRMASHLLIGFLIIILSEIPRLYSLWPDKHATKPFEEYFVDYKPKGSDLV